jgi:hypothetical protein
LKNNLAHAIYEIGENLTNLTVISYLHLIYGCILYKYRRIEENLRTLDEIRKLRYSIEKILNGKKEKHGQ